MSNITKNNRFAIKRITFRYRNLLSMIFDLLLFSIESLNTLTNQSNSYSYMGLMYLSCFTAINKLWIKFFLSISSSRDHGENYTKTFDFEVGKCTWWYIINWKMYLVAWVAAEKYLSMCSRNSFLRFNIAAALSSLFVSSYRWQNYQDL